MKNRHPIGFGLLAILMFVAGLVVPARLESPAPAEAAPGMLDWSIVDTPGSFGYRHDILWNSEINTLAVGPDGSTILAAVTRVTVPPAPPIVPPIRLFSTGNSGMDWSEGTYAQNVWDVAIAPDDSSCRAEVTSTAAVDAPVEVRITVDGGTTWEITNLSGLLAVGETIRCIDISVRYGGSHDIAVATTTGGGGGRIWVISSAGFGNWQDQSLAPSTLPVPFGTADYYAVKFSPTYNSDASLAVVFANATATFYNIGLRDIDANTTPTWAYSTPGIEVKDPNSPATASPGIGQLRKADLELPSDFSGQAASLRRAYISLDATAKVPDVTEAGIFRIDETTVYVLMDTTTTPTKDIYSISYFGTYASGKLLAGERMGFPCTATVPTWFTDSPTTCPIPCWYPALKPTTGAAAQGTCAPGSQTGTGAALVSWGGYGKLNGTLAYVATGSQAVTTGAAWYTPWLPFPGVNPIPNDESAFAISRNNGETWNQRSLIDTTIDWFNDVQVTPDCKTIYLASSDNVNMAGCDEFDSVWRSSSNPKVVSPLPAMPVGFYWERVFTHTTSLDCTGTQTDRPLLRIVPYCQDKEGQIVAWAAQYTKAQAWSPDFGDYWAMIVPRDDIQDFCFESSTVLYNLSPDGLVQKLPYTGTAWATTLPSVDSVIYSAHTIAAYPEGKVLVGAASQYNQLLYATSFSGNMNTDNPSFSVMSLAGKTPFTGDVHVAFHPKFKDNNTIFINDENYATATGSVYRNNPTAQIRWEDSDMMAVTNGAVGCNAPHQVPQSGLLLSFTGEALYSSHDITPGFTNSGVCRTVEDGTGKFGPLSGMPKPGIAWDCLNIFAPSNTENVTFTLQPTALRACGCCDLTTDTTLYALDNEFGGEFDPATAPPPPPLPPLPPPSPCPPLGYCPAGRQGMLWTFTDCVAKRGPKLITADKALIGCDPVSGRAQEVNLCWEQLCVSDRYDIEIAKDKDFTIRVIDWTAEAVCGGFQPVDVTKPCAYFPAGGRAAGYEGSAIALWGNLECGHTYYWRVKTRHGATGQWIRGPWSEARSFTVKAGLPATTPYFGLQLLSPNNGCLGCPVKPASFSWSLFKETTKYKFQLAKDAAMTQIVKEADVPTTAYEYDGTLDYSNNYFWRVMALEPAPSDWSATFSFQTEAAPKTLPPGAPTTRLWDLLALPLNAFLTWIAPLNIHPVPALPLLPWAGVLIAVCIILFIIWLVVMIAISRLLRKSPGGTRRT